MKIKHWYQSKTNWFNILVILQGWIPVIADSINGFQTGQLTLVYAMSSTIMGGINLVLRNFFTTTGIEGTTK